MATSRTWTSTASALRSSTQICASTIMPSSPENGSRNHHHVANLLEKSVRVKP
ncbi:hypothetical protein DEO72_LG2g2687 [Vigna unguiculata]|uniref:Uncharacterized protein n=1 Tax=Vigna unguiculata TaxID=3917 RepID=A0A4D6L1H1_VIGUN|nr:hypothetical protein DEO72_LG2g2687 [Vigna unguiculata]